MIRRRPVQLGLVHSALAMTLVPINSTLNRVMIGELGLSATLVALLASLPYALSPVQVAVGAWSDRHPVLGRRRTFYVLAGLLLCAAGVVAAPAAAALIARNFWPGLAAAAASFGAWGMGYNLAAVSYLALAAEAPDARERSRTVSVMWIMMILAVIATSLALGRLAPTWSPPALSRAFALVAAAALAAGAVGLVGLEPRARATAAHGQRRLSWADLLRVLGGNRQARIFFVYLLVLLTAILGQDVLLEPLGGEVLGMPLAETSRLAAVWGTCFLIAMAAAGALSRRVGRGTVARAGAVGAAAGLLGIAASAVAGPPGRPLFYASLVLLGTGAGLATLANLALMLEMTVTGREGLYMGAWGIASAVARLAGSTAGGLLRDVLGRTSPAAGYAAGFVLLALLLAVSLALLPRIDVASFRDGARIGNLRGGLGDQQA